jgi:hypothetical protein
VRSRKFRACMGAALATPVTFAALALPASQAHATPLVSRTTCSALKGTSASPTAKLRGCTEATTGGGGTIAGTGPNTDVVTWKNSGTTTFTYTHVLLSKDACPTGSDEYKWTGTVTASTGSASAVTGSVKSLICFTNNAKAKATLLQGTVWTF